MRAKLAADYEWRHVHGPVAVPPCPPSSRHRRSCPRDPGLPTTGDPAGARPSASPARTAQVVGRPAAATPRLTAWVATAGRAHRRGPAPRRRQGPARRAEGDPASGIDPSRLAERRPRRDRRGRRPDDLRLPRRTRAPTPARRPRVVDTVTILSPDRPQGRRRSARRATPSSSPRPTCVARDWVNTPPGDLRPAGLRRRHHGHAGTRRACASRSGTRSASPRRAAAASSASAPGSDSPPRLVTLTYNPDGAKTHLALVGKGITFDSGGLSIKPGASMMTMKCDMGGAAAIVAATVAIAPPRPADPRHGLRLHRREHAQRHAPRVPATCCACASGATVEVHNTDAEGRLVLADGLALAVEAEPDHIIDVATLTGACDRRARHAHHGRAGQRRRARSDTRARRGRAWPASRCGACRSPRR